MPTNLDRQFYFEDQVGMKKVEAPEDQSSENQPSPGNLQMLPVSLLPANVPEIFRDCDVVVECLDRAESKSNARLATSFFRETDRFGFRGLEGLDRAIISRSTA